jgi:hypothetical protein
VVLRDDRRGRRPPVVEQLTAEREPELADRAGRTDHVRGDLGNELVERDVCSGDVRRRQGVHGEDVVVNLAVRRRARTAVPDRAVVVGPLADRVAAVPLAAKASAATSAISPQYTAPGSGPAIRAARLRAIAGPTGSPVTIAASGVTARATGCGAPSGATSGRPMLMDARRHSPAIYCAKPSSKWMTPSPKPIVRMHPAVTRRGEPRGRSAPQ